MHTQRDTLQTLQAGAMAVPGPDQIEIMTYPRAEKYSDNPNKENEPLLGMQKSYVTIVLPSKSCTRPSTPGMVVDLYLKW